MQDISELQKRVDKYSKFTDSLIKEINIVNEDRLCNVSLIVEGRFDKYRVKIFFERVKSLSITETYNFSIWELDIKREGDLLIFDPNPTFTEGGNILIKAEKMSIVELK